MRSDVTADRNATGRSTSQLQGRDPDGGVKHEGTSLEVHQSLLMMVAADSTARESRLVEGVCICQLCMPRGAVMHG